jgi:hypothetical protein
MAAAVSVSLSLTHPFDRLHRPVRVPADETWIAPPAVDPPSAMTLLFAPFWRVKLAVSGAHLSRCARSIAIGNIEFPMPVHSYGGHAGVLMVSARRAIPYVPRLPAFLGGDRDDALEVQRTALLPLTNETAHASVAEGEIIDADVDRDDGEDLARTALVALLDRGNEVQPRIESSTFVLYPLWYAPITHEGHGEHFVLMSARDGKVISARYPRPRTISERVKRFFGT